jgi:hypothetical protein
MQSPAPAPQPAYTQAYTQQQPQYGYSGEGGGALSGVRGELRAAAERAARVIAAMRERENALAEAVTKASLARGQMPVLRAHAGM